MIVLPSYLSSHTIYGQGKLKESLFGGFGGFRPSLGPKRLLSRENARFANLTLKDTPILETHVKLLVGFDHIQEVFAKFSRKSAVFEIFDVLRPRKIPRQQFLPPKLAAMISGASAPVHSIFD